MVKISVGGYDDGEGPSNPTQKRPRVEFEDEEEEEEGGGGGGDEEEEEEEEEEEDQEQQLQHSYEMEDPPIGTQEAEQEHNNNETEGSVGSYANLGNSNDRGRSISAIITDPDALDCCICFEPLSVPVFQCENGHVACSNCCARLRNKCPMCSMPIGYNRCRAVEKLLECIKISCLNAKYGCKEMFSYSVKNDHEEDCIYIPCLCPHTGCSFVASSKELSLHFSHRHVGSGIQFTYDKFFTVFLNTDQKAIVLQEKNDANLFIVQNNRESLGNLVHVSCIGPKSMAVFHYDVLGRSRGSTLILQSVTNISQSIARTTPSTGFLLIPSDFFGSGQLQLDIRIKLQH